MIASIVGVFVATTKSKSPEQVAEEIEKRYPELDASLITAMELKPKQGERLGFLEQDVLRKAVTHSYENSWTSLIPGWHLVAAPLAGLIGLFAFAITMLCLMLFAKPLLEDPTIAFEDAAVDATNFVISVEPGSTEVERGTSLLVLARFEESFPPDAHLVFTDAEGVESKVSMTKSLDDPVFGARIGSVGAPLKYRVEYAEQVTDDFDVTVFDYPKLIRADATLKYPKYVEIEDKVIQDVRRVNAVQGTKAEFSFFVNKPVTSAVLFPRGTEGEPMDVEVDSKDPKKLTIDIEMLKSQKYELELTDDSNRENRTPPKFVLNVLENRLPDLKLLAPGRDVDASPIEEIQMSASAWDDFGLKSFGVSYEIPGGKADELELEQKQAGKKRKRVDHLLELETLGAQPDDLVSYHFWAEDIGPDGQRRRVFSDMFFAEVRHFDEIFRQGQAPAGGQQQQQQQGQQQGGNAQQAQEVAELQKEIINGTWKLIRRETAGELTEKFGSDSELLAESQQAAIASLAELAEKIEDPKSKAFIEPVRTFMNEAVLHLTQSNQDADVGALRPALSAEQAAYQGLLKLRAREHEIVRQQQQSQPGQGQQNNRQQQQLDQLNLKEDENRYENEKTAQEQTEQTQQQQEDRQVLSRLRELARRQNDLNERVKELQSALEEAKTAEEKEEIERRLKSLQEQQEQMLRDTEELLDRMNQEENQERMSEQSEQLEQTRENLQKASEALDQKEASRAAAEGTRAQRDLEDLRDEFQEKTSGQFTEQMRQMRNEAQELEEKQAEIASELSDQPELGTKENEAPSLRDTESDEPNVSEKLAEQQQAVEDLRKRMRETIEEAEPFEPLLAEELYDTYRDSEVSRPDEALKSARRSLGRGWLEDARTEEDRARQGIQQMREGIENAAERVLGDESEALKQARKTLEELNRELQGEINQRASEQGKEEQGERNSDGRADAADNERGENREREGEPTDRDDENPREGEGRGKQTDGESEEGDSGKSESDEEKPQEGSGKGQGKSQAGQPNDEEPQAGQGQAEQGQPGQGQPGQGQEGQPQEGNSQEGQGNGGGRNQNDQAQPNQDPNDQNPRERMLDQIRNAGGLNRPNQAANPEMWNPGGDQRIRQPLTGEDFRDWSDRLRDVEEMVADPELRAEASRIREQAREIRKDLKRHSEEPNWDLIKMKVARPLAELQDRVAEEIMRRDSDDALIPLDRDPIPAEYQDAVRRYYERIGSGK